MTGIESSARRRGQEPPPSALQALTTSCESKKDQVEASGAADVYLDELVGGDADIAFEQELRRNPYQVKIWLAYLKARAKAKPAIRYAHLCAGVRRFTEFQIYRALVCSLRTIAY